MISVGAAEYWFEWWLLGGIDGREGILSKQWGLLPTLGLLVSIVGLTTRTLGMATASTNFSHQIEETKRPEHALVTHGIYAVLRHPAYFGFFWWSVGTQLILLNPICLLAYTAATWHFFYNRIPYEEKKLVEFFGDSYIQYRKSSYIGIPLIAWASRIFYGS